jgi:acetyl esterase
MHLSITTHAPVVLEPASQEFVEATSTPPFLSPTAPARCSTTSRPPRSTSSSSRTAGSRVPAEVGDVRVRIVRPPDAEGTLPVILYMHGGGWVLGNADTHDRLVRELAVGTGAAVALVEYDRSPEAHYPVSQATAPPAAASVAQVSIAMWKPSVMAAGS